ncbi:MAG TPA: tetratricopeptide repeat protein [Mariprofundaceae bacterium]|nr:tetratricopeptide repeat protein [Mariprofundaceae bacterium]
MEYLQRIVLLIVVLMVSAGPVSVMAAPAAKPAAVSKRVAGIHSFLKQGNFSLAISAAQALLKTKVSDDERFQLLSVLAQAEEMSASFSGYTDVNTAVHAYESLRKEFPKRSNEADILWRIAWLYWKSQDLERADITTQTILQQHPRAPEARKAALLRARILIKKGAYPKARGVLLAYYGLGENINAREEAEGLAWMAIIDRAEGRTKEAFKTMKKSYASVPKVIRHDPTLYAAYIKLLAQFGPKDEALHHAEQFVKHYITEPESPAIRLLEADLLVQQGDDQKAADIYGILADRYGHRSVGKKAQMRQLMIWSRRTKERKKLSSTLKALSRIASSNQMSDIETESQLDQARILSRLAKVDDDPQRDVFQDRSIGLYALAASSTYKRFAEPAKKEGTVLFRHRLKEGLDQQQWLQSIVLWKRYPQLRPADAPELSFAVARAYMQLLDYTHGEAMLEKLYAEAKDTVWGQRVMLERARLWLDRGDSDGVSKIMHWLAGHEYTLYRQDLLLIVAHMQVNKRDFSTALQTLAGIQVGDLTPSLTSDYWHTTALVNVGLHRWHAGADAWRHLVGLRKGEARWDAMHAQAVALLKGGDTAAAEKVLLKIPENMRSPAWLFTMAKTMQKLGRFNEATDYLKKLADASPPNNYTTRARMLLAEQRADRLEQEGR